MGICRHCGSESKIISDMIGFCANCIKTHFNETWPEIKRIHEKSRAGFHLPTTPPKETNGIPCPLCFQKCQIPEGGTGYCGVRKVENGCIKGGRPHEGNLSYYHDPLPTNCVASFVCPAGTGSGYPDYAFTQGPEYGYKNLAVFYQACSFNCLYCQNYHFKDLAFSLKKIIAKDLAQAVDSATSCICYFGGDPASQVLHALKASKLARKHTRNRILRICWETNGSAQEPFLTEMAKLSLESGGCIKFDLKAWNELLHYALCGNTNQKTLENFKTLTKWTKKRPEPPFLIASTLLVPGYIEEKEVRSIAHFIADLNPEIPYSLLAFYPQFYLDDLPTTSRTHALRCQAIAKDAGLHHVHVGNLHLLGDDYG